MKTKFIVYLGILCLYCCNIQAQKLLSKKVPFKAGQKIQFLFTYPELIKMTSWDKNEIEISAKVRINNGRNNDAFVLEVKEEEGILQVSSVIKDLDNLPKMMMITRGDTKYYFDNDQDHDKAMQQFREEHGENGYGYSTRGVIKEITLEIKVPANAAFSIDAKFGLLELTNITAPVEAISKFGGIDMTLSPNAGKDFKLSTKFGEIMTNLRLDIKKNQTFEPYKWNIVQGKLNGGGEMCHLESKFGNIYLRKSQ